MKINVPEKYADLYLKALSEKKKTLEAKIEDFRKEITEIDNHIQALTSLSIFQDSTTYPQVKGDNTTYQNEWSWTRKISHYQEVTEKIFTAGDIVDYIIEKEPELNKSKTRSSISAALSNKNKKGVYIKFIDPVTSSTYYGPTEWFNPHGQPELEYLPDHVKDHITRK